MVANVHALRYTAINLNHVTLHHVTLHEPPLQLESVHKPFTITPDLLSRFYD